MAFLGANGSRRASNQRYSPSQLEPEGRWNDWRATEVQSLGFSQRISYENTDRG